MLIPILLNESLKIWVTFGQLCLSIYAQMPNDSYQDFLDAIPANLVSYTGFSLCIIAGGFNQYDVRFFIHFGPVNTVNSPIGMNVVVEIFLMIRPDIFSASYRSPTSSSDHAISKVLFKIYSHANQRHFTHRRDRKIGDRPICSQTVIMLNQILSQTDFSSVLDTDVSVSWDHLTSDPNFFNFCCPIETLNPLRLLLIPSTRTT